MSYDRTAPYRQEIERYGENTVVKMKAAYHRRNILPRLSVVMAGGRRSILEIGPGIGVLADLLLAEFPDIAYTAWDVDPVILARLQKRHPHIRTRALPAVADFEKEAPERFDAIVGLDVWEHIPRKEVQTFTQQVYRRLKPQGVLVIQVPNWSCPLTPHCIHAGDITHRTAFNEFSIRQLLIQAGIPAGELQLHPYFFPLGFIGGLRESLRWMALLAARFGQAVLGVPRCRILTPNLVAVVRKGCGRKPAGT